jgi:hypothetical protein
MGLRIGSEDTPFDIDPDKLMTGVTCLLAAPGSGKGNLVSVMCEELFEKNLRFAIIDTEGEYLGLHETYKAIWLSKDKTCDFELDEIDEAFLSQMAVRAYKSAPIVLDLKGTDETERLQWIKLFLSKINDASSQSKSAYLVILDEAQRYANNKSIMKIVLDIQETGRKRGLGLLLSTQKPSSLNTSVLRGCFNQIVGKLNQSELRTFVELFGDRGLPNRLDNLKRGVFYLLGGFSQSPQRVQIREKKIRDLTKTPIAVPSQPETIDAMREEYRAHKLARTTELKDLLRKVGLSPEKKLDEFLAEQIYRNKWGIAIDWHVVLPACQLFDETGNILREYAVGYDPALDLESVKKRIAKEWALNKIEFRDLVERFGIDKRTRKKFDPDKTKYYVDCMNWPPLIDDMKEKEELRIKLGPVKFSTIVAIEDAMAQPNIKIGNRSLNLHQHLSRLKTNTPRSVFLAGVGIHLSVISKDGRIILLRRSQATYYYPSKWSISVDETMKGEPDKYGPADKDFKDIGVRGLKEELGISHAKKNDVKIVAFAGEYDYLEFSVHAHYKCEKLTAAQIKDRWEIVRPDWMESDAFMAVPADLDSLVQLLIEGIPIQDKNQTSFEKLDPDGARLNILLYLLRRYGIDETKVRLARLLPN